MMTKSHRRLVGMSVALMVPLGVFNSFHGEQDCTAWDVRFRTYNTLKISLHWN